MVAVGFALGTLAVVCIVKEAGAAATCSLLARALPLLPLAIAVEAGRIGAEVLASRKLFAMLKTEVPMQAIVRAQLVGYSVCNTMPVGRMAGEATKAGLLTSHAGLAKTAAVATVTQALHLIASALILVPCILAARSTNASFALSATILGQCAVLLAIGTTILLVAYFVPSDGTWFRRLPKVGSALQSFRAAIRQLPSFPFHALGYLFMSRGLQVMLIAVLARAVGSPYSLAGPFVAQAVLIVGASVADFIPGQVGALEGIFSFFAPAIGMSKTNSVAVALLIHAVQALWILVGVLVLVLARGKKKLAQPPFYPALVIRCEGSSSFKAS
jgi:hypothetical protein